MGIQVRERPPLALSMIVTPPAFNVAQSRWAADDQHVINIPNDLTFTTTMPGGFEQASCTLERDPRINWPDIQEFENVAIMGLGGSVVAWEGRLEEYPSTGGSQANLQPQIYGWQSHLQDDAGAAMIYVDQDLSNWQGPSTARQIQLLTAGYAADNAGSVASNPSGTPAFVTDLTGAWAAATVTEGWYDSGAAGPIANLYYAWEKGTTIDPSDTNWEWDAGVSSDDLDTTNDASGNLRGAGPGSGTVTATGTRRFARVQAYYTAAAGADGTDYPVYWGPLAVMGNHGLSGLGTPPVNFTAAQIIGHAVSTWAPKISFTDTSLQPSSFQIGQAVFQPTTVAAIIQQVTQYELLDWAVWEQESGHPGPTFYLNFRGVRGNSWVSRVGDCQLQAAGPQASNIYNGVVVLWTNVDGTAGSVGPPGSSANYTTSNLASSGDAASNAGLKKWGLLTLGTSTQAAAIQAGEAFLEVQAQINTSGQASLVGHVQNTAGVWLPAWMVRAGDTLTVLDAADSSARRIVSTSYDASSVTNTVQLDQPPATMTALLAQMSEVIQPLGLS